MPFRPTGPDPQRVAPALKPFSIYEGCHLYDGVRRQVDDCVQAPECDVFAVVHPRIARPRRVGAREPGSEVHRDSSAARGRGAVRGKGASATRSSPGRARDRAWQRLYGLHDACLQQNVEFERQRQCMDYDDHDFAFVPRGASPDSRVTVDGAPRATISDGRGQRIGDAQDEDGIYLVGVGG